MQLLTQVLDDGMKAGIDTFRQAVLRSMVDATSIGGFRHPSPTTSEDRIVQHLDRWLLDDEQKSALASHPWQVFLLQAAACLCETGLLARAIPSTDSGISQRAQDWIRNHWQVLGIQDPSLAVILVRICRELGDVSDMELPSRHSGETAYAGATINTGLIASSIRLARDLELKSDATFAAVIAHLPDGPDDPPRLRDAFDVDDIGPHPYMPTTIQVKIRCRDAELHRGLKHYESDVQERLNQINQRIRPRFLFSAIIFEIEPEGYRPVDLKFSVDTSAALQLFMGNRLYADKRVFLRELIQNAVDACSLRKLHESSYTPAISVAFNDDISRIIVRDNGIGMNRQWLEKYFLSIGISFYQSDEVRSINRDPHIDIGFISQFGIGFLSSFLVADKIVINTRKRRSEGLRVTITSLKDYFDIRPLDEAMPVGTEVTLHLSPSQTNYCRSLEFVGYLKTNIRFLQIPVHFTDERGKTILLGNAPMSYEIHGKGEGDFAAPVAFDDAEGYIYLGAQVHDQRIFALETTIGGVSVFQDGIFVTQDDTLLPVGARQNVIGRINLKGRDKCELSMDRNRIFWPGEHKRHVRQKIRMAMANVANRVISALDQQEADPRTRQSIVNHLAIFFDFSEVDDDLHDGLCPPLQKVVDKRFRDFVRVHFAHTRSASGIPEADGYGEKWQRHILASFSARN